MSAAVTPRRVLIASRFLKNAHIAALACRRAGLPYFVACALLEKESGGRNVYGHDTGGALSGFPRPVNRANWQVFRWMVIDQGHTSNGVGPCQLTYPGFFTDMEKHGLKPWRAYHNMLYGFRLLARYHRDSHSWVKAGERYNGALSYGQDLEAKIRVWKQRLHIR